MEKESPPPYSSGPPPPGFASPHQPEPPLQPPYISSYAQQEAHQPATQVLIIPGPAVCFGPNPKRLICPSCHAQISTSIKTEPNTKTHLFALVLCLFGFYCCVCVPYFVDSCQSQNHYCPHCKAFLGSYQN